MTAFSLAEYYHSRTKYDPETLSQQSQPIDWDHQPSPYKIYKIGHEIALRDVADPLLVRLGQLLGLSYGLTQRVRTADGDMYLRSAPSAGGLYPAELYVLSAGLPQLPAGLYSYQPQSHGLIRFWDCDVWPELQRACLFHPALEQTRLAIVTTAIFERSAWRYHDRAYRRVCLDTGHLLGNVDLACSVVDFRPHWIGGFVDVWMNQLLFLDPEVEAVLTVAAIADLLELSQNLPSFPVSLPSALQVDYPEIPAGRLIGGLHGATQINPELGESFNWRTIGRPRGVDGYNFPFCMRVEMGSEPIDWGLELGGLSGAMMRRRSTRGYSGERLSVTELGLLLDFTYQPEHYRLQGLNGEPDYFALELIETFVVISGVDGLDEGCYYYAPGAQELRQVRFKNFRDELHYLCLGQELGRDAAAVVFHTAKLAVAVERFGDRAYRYLHLDAGRLGQRLNVGAIGLGVGVSGIAGFFDDLVNEVLGIPKDEAVLYITTLGRGRSR
jgi:SagB-type dehydrogenase family enzyme